MGHHKCAQQTCLVFSHPDSTVGIGIAPIHTKKVRGLYRRLGITPCPEGISPKEWETFRKECKELDGFLFITPEYNRSLPAVLKNALDVGSRPYGQNVWDGKPGAVISTSIGKISGFGANHHLRQSAVFLNILMLQQPEASIGDVASLLDEKGDLVDEGTQTFLQNVGSAFAQWIATCSKK